VPLVVMVVLMAEVPLTEKLVNPVSVSAAASPSTALPVNVRLCALPTTVPRVVIVLPASAASASRVRLSLNICVPVV